MNAKNVIIFGIGKIQKDFEYIFDQFSVEGYLIDEEYQEITEWNKKPIYRLADFECTVKYHVIICDYDKDDKAKKLNKAGMKYKINYSFADDYFTTLDINIDEISKGKNLYVWGTGYHAGVFLNDEYFYQRTSACIDNNVNSRRKVFRNKSILHPLEINEWKDKYIVVAANAYYEIRKQLEKYGLKENQDFIWSRYLVNKPSEMLKKTIYDRSQYDLVCDTMFSTYEIESTGEVTCCCTTFINERIGNLVYQDFKDIWYSNTHKILCLSSANKTFTFCKKDMCPVLMEKKRKEYQNTYKETGEYKKIEKSPKVMLVSIDSSCNLYCESCRESICSLRGAEKEKADIMADKLLADDNFSNAEFIVMAGNGEVFLSKIYEKLWSDEKTKNVKRFRLLSNGTLFTPQRWEKFSEGRTSEVVATFSIDAATPDIYVQVRRGGNFRQLMKNLEFASQLRKNGKLAYFQISFVVQRKNYKEMPMFVELGKRLGVDKVFFTRILNWGTYSKEEFEKISMTDEDGHANSELQEILNLPILQESIVDLGTINSKNNEKEYNYIYNYYLWEIDRYLKKRRN